MDSNFKNILITGNSKGLGLEITKNLLQKDYCIYAVNRTISKELELLLVQYPNRLKLDKFDLRDYKNIKKECFNKLVGYKIPIHGFVNNAAMAYDDIITNLKHESLEQMFAVNVFAPFTLSNLVIRNMLFHKTKGSIVHISSISVHTGYKGLSMYASTKGALEAFSKNLAREWGETGIRSNCIVAGFMETDMSAGLSSNQKQRIYARNSLKKEVSIQSVANTTEFLISEKSLSITGQNIFVDSGTI